MSHKVSKEDTEALLRDKYAGRTGFDVAYVKASDEYRADVERLAAGEPLAYVIGWVPFLGLRIYFDAKVDDANELRSFASSTFQSSFVRPLIPRAETEWWTEQLIAHVKYKFENRTFTFFDLCAGSGAIGLAILAACKNARVFFSDIEPCFESVIRRNLKENNLDESRAEIKIGNLFEPFNDSSFDIIATNPPYIPETRKTSLSFSVVEFEPHTALFAGTDGLEICKKIIAHASDYVKASGELWMECDIENIAEAERFAAELYPLTETTVHRDQYGRPRLLVTHFS